MSCSSRFPMMIVSFAALALLIGEADARADPAKVAAAMAGKPYTVTVARISAKKGEPARGTVLIKPSGGWHLNLDYPTSLKLNPPQGVTAQKAQLGRQDAKLSEQEGSFEVVLTSVEGGRKTIPGDLRFAVCTETSCDPQRSLVSIEMDVK